MVGLSIGTEFVGLSVNVGFAHSLQLYEVDPFSIPHGYQVLKRCRRIMSAVNPSSLSKVQSTWEQDVTAFRRMRSTFQACGGESSFELRIAS
jgi:hypothetical protein